MHVPRSVYHSLSNAKWEMWFSRLLFKIFWWISPLGKCIQLTIYSIRQSFGHPKNISIILEKFHDFNIFSLLHDHWTSALYQNLFIHTYVVFVLWSSYTNNEINSAKNETYMWFSVVVGGKHLLELTTFLSAFILLALPYSCAAILMYVCILV